jgi:two-component system sensor histidine kinase CiaH
VYFNIFVLIGAGFASYWLARRTLLPIEASNERQRRFVADASHELRTPLTALRTSTEVALLDQAAKSAELREALQGNLEDIDKLTSLLTSLMRLSQLDTSTAQMKFTALSAAQVVNEAIQQTTVRANARDIIIDNQAAGLPLFGDRESIVQLLVTLLDNAIKYSPNKSVVNVTASQDDGQTTIIVADHGIGIDPNALRHVFDRFYRADKARSGSDGYGLGLSIAKQIADLHHGTITLTSRVGKGTAAKVILPSSAPRAT